MEYLKDITEFVFIEDKIQDADLIFIPGSVYPELGENAARLWKENRAKWVLPSGRYGIKGDSFLGPDSKREKYSGAYKTEWEFLKDILVKCNVLEENILKEDRARNTYENAIYSRQAVKEAGLTVHSAIICCQAYHARRCSMYYQTMFPKTSFFISPVETQGINRNNWYLTEKGIALVMGELERFGTQFLDIIKRWMYSKDLREEIVPMSVETHDVFYREELMTAFYSCPPKEQNKLIRWINQGSSEEKAVRLDAVVSFLKNT